MPPALTDIEQAVLAVIDDDADGWFNYFYPGIVQAAGGDLDAAQAACKRLRTLRLIDSEGRGRWAQYGKKAAVVS